MQLLTRTVPAAKHSAWRRGASVQTSHSGCIAEAVNSEIVFECTECCDGPDECHGADALMINLCINVLVCSFATLMHKVTLRIRSSRRCSAKKGNLGDCACTN